MDAQKKRVIPVVLAVLGILVVSVLLVAANRPDDFRVERSIEIKASGQDVYDQVADFKRWLAWSPYEKKDPAMQRMMGEVSAGTGARYGWKGNGEVGAGRMEITEAVPGELVRIRLDFLEPMEMTNTAEFSFVQRGNRTRVTWAMYGKTGFPGKLVGLFVDCDAMIGRDFEEGLKALREVSEQKK